MLTSTNVISLGLGLSAPWKLTDQRLDTACTPNELHLAVQATRGSLFPCPDCKELCKAHDFKEFTWRHLNFFQHHCYITAKVPRVKCDNHGVKRVEVPWAREGSRFTLLFEEAALTLVREMPVSAAARIMEITDKRLWRVVEFYVSDALSRLDLSDLKAIGLDETACKRGHKYVTIFIDPSRKTNPVIFVTPGKDSSCIKRFEEFLKQQGGNSDNILGIVCDMSPAFLSATKKTFQNAKVTVDWFHVVQLFTKGVDTVRRLESKKHQLPKKLRWAVLKSGEDDTLTDHQKVALKELNEGGFATATAYRIKELLRWIQKAETVQAAKWRLTHFLRHARKECETYEEGLLDPIRKALTTVEAHSEEIVQRWHSKHTNARMEGLNGVFKAVRARARGYRNVQSFMTMIYLIGAPLEFLF